MTNSARVFLSILALTILGSVLPDATRIMPQPFSILPASAAAVFIFAGYVIASISAHASGRRWVFYALNTLYWLGAGGWILFGFLADIPPTYHQIFRWLFSMSLAAIPLFVVLVFKWTADQNHPKPKETHY